MSLFPKLDTPTHTVTLPISKIPVTFRPYLTKEEKLLLMALESKDSKIIMETIRQIAINCVVTPDKLDVDNLSVIDLEFLFLHLRAKSKGEVIEAQFSCKAEVPQEDGTTVTCNHPIMFTTRIDNLEVKGLDKYNNVIPLTDKIGVTMRLTRYKDMVESTVSRPDDTAIEKAYAVIAAGIESIYDAEQVYQVDKSNRKDLDEFLGSLTHDQFKKIEDFFERAPKIDYTFNVKCGKCAFDHMIQYADISSFF
jgi:hypothetical protein